MIQHETNKGVDHFPMATVDFIRAESRSFPKDAIKNSFVLFRRPFHNHESLDGLWTWAMRQRCALL
jgi:hypothetical protein